MPYSYSQYSTHAKCGLKYRYRYVDKVDVPREQSAAMNRGTMLHNSIEAFLKKEIEALPVEIDYYTQWLSHLRDTPEITVSPEHKYAFKSDWTLTDWDDPDAYVRTILDLQVKTKDALNVVEFKTGKEYDDHTEQRQLYGLAALLAEPEYSEVTVTGTYLDLKQVRPQTYNRQYVDEMKERWTSYFDLLQKPETWIANPSYSCKWCPFSKYNGGPCEF